MTAARKYVGVEVDGRWSEPERVVYRFAREDGGVDVYTADEMRRSHWWRELPPSIAKMIEANLAPLPRRPCSMRR